MRHTPVLTRQPMLLGTLATFCFSLIPSLAVSQTTEYPKAYTEVIQSPKSTPRAFETEFAQTFSADTPRVLQLGRSACSPLDNKALIRT
jgi:hypothetical protein